MTANINPSHEQTHRKFRYFDGRHLEFRQKCIGLLPQIFKERIYEKKGFASIFEYAGKLAGLSHEQVSRALNLHTRFENMPVLKNLLETGEVSINKLARVASIATAENEKTLAEHVKILSKNSVETLVRDFRRAEDDQPKTCTQDGLQKPLFKQISVPGHDAQPEEKFANQAKILELKLTTNNLEKLLELQNKGIDINKIIETALQNREEEISKSKEEAAQKTGPAKSRYIPTAIMKIINEEQGNLCSAPGCKKTAEITHHELPFSMTKNHDPRNLKKLCGAHHEMAHMINLRFYRSRNLAFNSS